MARFKARGMARTLFAAALGAAWILDLGTGERAILDSYISMMQKAASHAQSAGMQISAKPHGGITTTTDDLIGVYQNVNHPAYGRNQAICD